MIFGQRDEYAVAMYIRRETLLAGGITQLDGDKACHYARLELESAGYQSAQITQVEAYENTEGWLVFVTATPERDMCFLFTDRNDFLDAVNAAGLRPCPRHVWLRSDGSVAAKLPDLPVLSEYGKPIDGTELYLRHLEEHCLEMK